MAIVNLTQAAELAGIGRSTLWRKSKAGVLSTTKFPDGSPGIDTAELFRVFPRETDIKAQVIHEETSLELLKQEVVHLKERLLDKDKIIEIQAQALRMLEHKVAPITSVESVPKTFEQNQEQEAAPVIETLTPIDVSATPLDAPTPPRSWWAKVMGRR